MTLAARAIPVKQKRLKNEFLCAIPPIHDKSILFLFLFLLFLFFFFLSSVKFCFVSSQSLAPPTLAKSTCMWVCCTTYRCTQEAYWARVRGFAKPKWLRGSVTPAEVAAFTVKATETAIASNAVYTVPSIVYSTIKPISVACLWLRYLAHKNIFPPAVNTARKNLWSPSDLFLTLRTVNGDFSEVISLFRVLVLLLDAIRQRHVKGERFVTRYVLCVSVRWLSLRRGRQ